MIIRHSVFSQNTRLIYLCGESTAILYDTDDKRKAGSAEEGVFDRICMDKFGCASAIKARFIALGLHKFSENRIFTDAYDYSSVICLEELDADGLAQGDVLMRVGEETCVGVAPEDLDLVAVTATAQQETAVGRDVEHAGMGCCGLIADAREQSRLAVDGEDGDALGFQTIAGIQETAIGTEVYICSASSPHAVRDDFLERL